jgi:hypothetical protein
MTEDPKPMPEPSPPSSPTGAGPSPIGGVDYTPNFGKQYDRSGWTLPVVGGVLIGALVLGFLGFLVYAYLGAKQPGLGGIESVTAVGLGDQKSVLVAVTLFLTNRQDHPFWIEHVQGKLETNDGQWSDDAAAASDHARYFEAFPALRANVTAPLKYDDKLKPGQQVRGTVVFSFPVTKVQFDQRKSLSVLVQPHGMRLITIVEDKK